MNKLVIVLSILFAIFIHINTIECVCKKLGEECRKLPNKQCCKGSVCQLKGLKGKCVRCLPNGYFCTKSKDCCRGKCKMLKCNDNGSHMKIKKIK
ncbi:unnamed protein product [Heterobilharzia americana]|nr:unnamed protein product [Heterobilharzia americana]